VGGLHVGILDKKNRPDGADGCVFSFVCE
jgi:hypothetical protein